MWFLREFPRSSTMYFATASVGLPPRSSIARIRGFLNMLSRDPLGAFDEVEEYTMELRRSFAELVDSRPMDIAIVGTGTLEGIERGLSSLRCREGGNVVTDDLEFPGLLNLVITWARSSGCEVRIVQHINGSLRIEDFRRLIDERTVAVVVSSVQWINGFRIDLEALGELVSRYGAYLIVDGIQEVGVRRPSLKYVDMLSAATHKWLLGPFGVALAYVGPRLRELWGILGYENAIPHQDWGHYFADPNKSPRNLMLAVPNDARVFDTPGTKSLLGIVGSSASLRLIGDVGISEVERRVRDMRDRLIEGLGDYVKLLTPPGDWSGIVTVSSRDDDGLAAYLARRGVRVALRGMSGLRGVRISIHLYNTPEGVDSLINLIRRYLG